MIKKLKEDWIMFKKLGVLFFAIILLFVPSAIFAGECITIQDGKLLSSGGVIIETGFDEWGYNYQAHLFNGDYCDAYRNAEWCQPYKGIDLVMKWNNAWLSNQDCDGDGFLDRHYGFTSYIGSGAWTTNHQKGTYIDGNGKKQRWEYFCKIVAVPEDAYTQADGYWYTSEGIQIGEIIWGDFAIIQSIYNDTGTGDHGIEYLSPNNAGLGFMTPKQ